MKPAIFIPDQLGHWLDSVAKKHGLNRSEFYQRAGEMYAHVLEQGDKTSRINAAIAAVGQENALLSSESARRVIDEGGWQW